LSVLEQEISRIWRVEDDRLHLSFHPGQWRAYDSAARFTAVIAGTQSGKTSFGPLWLYREIMQRGPGDYMVVTPTFPLLELKALPEFKRIFETILRLGTYTSSPSKKFTFHPEIMPETAVIFGYASDPDSLESATAKAAWLDEAGQKKFKLASWEAIQRRLSLAQGRALITTTPYDLGWLKQKIYDPWSKGNKDYQVVRFDSTENPAFPVEEFERARRELPGWKFNMFYRGMFERPAGLIYDCFNEVKHKCPRFPIPAHWPRFLGLDFGGVNTAGLFIAREPGTSRLYYYREYKAGGRTAKEHTRLLLKDEPMPTCAGGSKSEGQWRDEFRAAGLPIKEPVITDVEVGIDRVYGAHKRDEIIVFDDLEGYLEEKLTYSRKLDEMGEPTEDIEDKNAFHFMDAERYIISLIAQGAAPPPATGGPRTAYVNFKNSKVR
jgi:hypothetical protein